MEEENKLNSLTSKELEEVLRKFLKSQEDLQKETEQEGYKTPSEELDLILSKYFTTKEELELLNQNDLQTTEEFQNVLFSKIDTLSTNVQYSNNLSYVAITVSGAVLIGILFNKFINYFF